MSSQTLDALNTHLRFGASSKDAIARVAKDFSKAATKDAKPQAKSSVRKAKK